jgi:hypothetical protein
MMVIPRLFLLLVVGLAPACAPAHVVSTPGPAPVTGDRIRYAARSDPTAFTTARLVSLDADSLIFERLVIDRAQHWVPSSLPTDSIARLQVRIGRRGNAGRGAIIGALVGLAAAVSCASEEPGWLTPTPGECFVGLGLSGLATGAFIGMLIRSDVWAPTALPSRPQAPVAGPVPVSALPVGMGIRIPIRLTGP